MENQFKKLLPLACAMSFLVLIGCKNNDDIIPKAESEFADSLLLKDNAGERTSATVYIKDLTAGATSFKVLVKLTSTDGKMRRMYMTQNLVGAGAEPYELQVVGIDKKADGSLDIGSKYGAAASFELTFNVLTSLTAGTVVYKIWATKAKGDYRDTSNDLVVGVGTLSINYGGTNPATAIKAYTAKILAAPLDDGTSETFLSLLDGKVYKVKEGGETSAFWDFGYYYGATGKASLASTNDYPSTIIDVKSLAEETELNKTYFKLSSKTTAEFEAITKSTDLAFISKPANQKITGLKENNVIEFVDNYGKKGLIKVTEIKGTWNSTDYIKIDIKVQP